MPLEPFVHDAVVVLDPDGDPGAPGAAVTVALCGHWEHAGPCPLAPHHTSAVPQGTELVLRMLFAVDPAAEAQVRTSIGAALAAGRLTGPDGRTTTWTLRSAAPGTVVPDEAEHAGRLAAR